MPKAKTYTYHIEEPLPHADRLNELGAAGWKFESLWSQNRALFSNEDAIEPEAETEEEE
jgi:hypothetical protein